MGNSVVALPVSVEQIAAAINQMSVVEQQRLLTLTPRLRQVAATAPIRTKEQIATSVAAFGAVSPLCIHHSSRISLPQVLRPDYIS